MKHKTALGATVKITPNLRPQKLRIVNPLNKSLFYVILKEMTIYVILIITGIAEKDVNK